ncbi:waprin-Thr1 isoform X1 [Eurosta solidaginis]|uniref:waprin-Thr1 isoform X1 n=1 Tax=Eurosta solidaginis TaxID=178769 RepID=UPI0035309C43
MFRHNGLSANNNNGAATLQVILPLLLLLTLVVISNAQTGCPSSTKVYSCTPKCKHDSDCSSIGGKCCPNLCNERSCIQRNQVDMDSKSGGSKYADSSNQGSYCGNTKCSPYEKCEMDRSTKRMKCVRT